MTGFQTMFALKVLERKLLRDLWRLKGQVLAIAMVIGAGVALAVMSFGTLGSLIETRDAYYQRYRFADVFAAVKRAPERLARKVARIEGVTAVETRVVADVTLDVPGVIQPVTGRLVSLAADHENGLNKVVLRSGRWPEPDHADEALLGETFAQANSLNIGDGLSAIINGAKRNLRVVGTVLSPEYVYTIPPGEMMPDDRRFGVIWMNRKALAAAFDMDGAFNDLSLTLLRGASRAAVIERLDRLLEPYGGIGAYDRKDHQSNSFLSSELDQLVNFGRVGPVIFLGVAAFLLNIVITRLVGTEREQIGVFKAFGYSGWEIGLHYFLFSAALVVLGTLLGFAVGDWLGREITEMYARFYRFPFLYYRFDARVMAASGLVSMVAGLLGAANAVRGAVRLEPAVAMAPPAPTSYRKSVLASLIPERMMGQPTRMIFRHLWRWPMRTVMTALGVAMSVAIMVGALFTFDSIDFLLDVQFFQSMRQDATVSFHDPLPPMVLSDARRLPGVVLAEGFRAAPVRLECGSRSRRVGLVGLDAGASLNRLLDVNQRQIYAPPEGIVLSDKLAEILGCGAGDDVTVKALTGRRAIKVLPVTALAKEYFGLAAYMDMAALNRFMGEGPSVSGVYLKIDDNAADEFYKALKETPAVAGVTMQKESLATFRRTIAESIDIMILMYVVFAALIAIGVVYNAARVTLSERGRELASLRVMGFTRGEAAYILLGELALIALIALPMGSVLGYGLAWLMALGLDTELYRIPLIVEPATYGRAIILVIAAAVVSGLIVSRRINRLDLIAVLKTRE